MPFYESGICQAYVERHGATVSAEIWCSSLDCYTCLQLLSPEMSVFHRPCSLHSRSWVSGLISLPHRQNVSCELGPGKYILSDSILLRSLWVIPLDLSAAVASCSFSEALGTDLETTFGPQTCTFPAGVIPHHPVGMFRQLNCLPFTFGFTQPVQSSLRETTSIEKKWNPWA